MSMGYNWLKFALLPGALTLGLAACDQQGPMEEAGEEIDEQFEEQGNLTEGPAERTGEALDEAAEDVERSVDEATENAN